MPIKIYFNFVTLGIDRVQLPHDPVGFDASEFFFGRRTDGLGLYVKYAAQNQRWKVTKEGLPDIFELVMRSKNAKGYEAVVGVDIELDEDVVQSYEIDFSTSTTNTVDYIEFQLVLPNELAVFERNYEANANLLGTKRLDGEYMSPLQLQLALQKAKPINQKSRYEMVNFQYNYDQPTAPNEYAFFTNGVYFNPISKVVKYGIKNTFAGWLQNFDTEDGDPFRILQARTNMRDVKITFNLDVLYKYRPDERTDVGNKAGSISLVVKYGQTYDTATILNAPESMYYNGFNGHDDRDLQLPSTLTATIPYLNNTDIVWVYFRVGSLNATVNRIVFGGNTSIDVTATSISEDIVINVANVHDVMEKHAECIANATIYAPRWDETGEFRNEYFSTANLMRGLLDKPFNITTKKIVDGYLPMYKGDYQLTKDGEIFYGRGEVDFLRDYFCGSFPQTQFRDIQKSVNPDYCINLFELKYNTYQSQKENETANTEDEVHGEAQYKLPNKRANNTKSVTVDVVASAFSWEETKNKAYKVTDTAATQDDGKIYVGRFLPFSTDVNARRRRTTYNLQHQQGPNGTLILVNQQNNGEQDFSWILLGIDQTSTFRILTAGNQGVYNVVEVTAQRLTLIPLTGTNNNIPEQNTTFQYSVSLSVQLVNATNEEFTTIQGVSDPDNYANLDKTVGRLVKRYYGSYLASNNIHAEGLISNTLYNNNTNEVITRMTDETEAVIEGYQHGDFIPQGAVISPEMYDNMQLIMTLSDFFTTVDTLQEERGWLLTWNEEGLPIKVHPNEMKFTILDRGEDDPIGICNCVMLERYQPYIIDIFSDGTGYVRFTLNTTQSWSEISFSVDPISEKVSIFDANGRLLFIPVYWDRIRFNETMPESLDELQLLLQSISI